MKSDAATYYRTQQDIADVQTLYEDWQWLLGEVQIVQAHAQSLFGDLLFSDGRGQAYLLDTIEGSLLPLTDWQTPLRDTEWLDQYFMIALAQQAAAQSITPKPDELLNFQVPPILGGSFEPDNVSVISARVGLSITGQLQRQIKDLPPGAKISGFKLQDPT